MMVTLCCDSSINRKTRVRETEVDKWTEKQIEAKKKWEKTVTEQFIESYPLRCVILKDGSRVIQKNALKSQIICSHEQW